jgi:hypothetical protein
MFIGFIVALVQPLPEGRSNYSMVTASVYAIGGILACALVVLDCVLVVFAGPVHYSFRSLFKRDSVVKFMDDLTHAWYFPKLGYSALRLVLFTVLCVFASLENTWFVYVIMYIFTGYEMVNMCKNCCADIHDLCVQSVSITVALEDVILSIPRIRDNTTLTRSVLTDFYETTLAEVEKAQHTDFSGVFARRTQARKMLKILHILYHLNRYIKYHVK